MMDTNNSVNTNMLHSTSSRIELNDLDDLEKKELGRVMMIATEKDEKRKERIY